MGQDHCLVKDQRISDCSYQSKVQLQQPGLTENQIKML